MSSIDRQVSKTGNIVPSDLENHYERSVGQQEVLSEMHNRLNEPSFDIAYYPAEPGMYNYNPNLTAEGMLPRPKITLVQLQGRLRMK